MRPHVGDVPPKFPMRGMVHVMAMMPLECRHFFVLAPFNNSFRITLIESCGTLRKYCWLVDDAFT